MYVTTRDLTRIARAASVAQRSQHRFRMGAVLVRAGAELGSSPNISKNDPRVVNHLSCSVHAEIGALRQARTPKGATIYVVRLGAGGQSLLAQPCPRCIVRLVTARVERAVWTTPGGCASARLRDLY